MYMSYTLDFEKFINPLEAQMQQMKSEVGSNSSMLKEVESLGDQIEKMLSNLYENLDPWQKVQVARHPDRPTGKHYVQKLIKDFVPISGDRAISDDPAIVCGLGVFEGNPVAVIAHNKGLNLEERLETNFGMAHPQAYRKVIRVFELANRFNLPILSFVDTKGAAANKNSEEGGQSFALADCIRASFCLEVPFISVIVGEGGSGGAIALASGHSLLMLTNSVFSVASPDACASILWKDRAFSGQAAKALKVTSSELIKLGIIDKEIKEPVGGAHRFPEKTYEMVKKALEKELQALSKLSHVQLKELQQNRVGKF